MKLHEATIIKDAKRLSALATLNGRYAYCPDCLTIFVDDLPVKCELDCPNGCKREDVSVRLHRGLLEGDVKQGVARCALDKLLKALNHRDVTIVDIDVDENSLFIRHRPAPEPVAVREAPPLPDPSKISGKL